MVAVATRTGRRATTLSAQWPSANQEEFAASPPVGVGTILAGAGLPPSKVPFVVVLSAWFNAESGDPVSSGDRYRFSVRENVVGAETLGDCTQEVAAGTSRMTFHIPMTRPVRYTAGAAPAFVFLLDRITGSGSMVLNPGNPCWMTALRFPAPE